MKVANPEAVVKLVSKIAFPILTITSLRDCCLLLLLEYSCWYLFIRNTQLVTPIIIIRGGINAVKTVIS